MATTSDTDIFNLALDLLREKPITSISSPNTPIESLAARWYDVIRKAILEAYNWNFANLGEAIPRGGTPTITKYADFYDFPNDYLKLTAINDPDYPLQRYAYRIESRALYINNGGDASIDVWFIHDITDVTKMSDTFKLLFSGELAWAIANKVTAKSSFRASVKNFLDVWRQRALASNGQSRPPIRYERSKIVDSGLRVATPAQIAGEYKFNFNPNA